MQPYTKLQWRPFISIAKAALYHPHPLRPVQLLYGQVTLLHGHNNLGRWFPVIACDLLTVDTLEGP